MRYFKPEYIERMKPQIIKRGMEFILAAMLIFSLLSFFETDERIPTRSFVLTSEMDESGRENLLNRRHITLLESDNLIKSISCFDVNEKGMVAVGIEQIGTKGIVAVYDSDGNYQYGYSFIAYGSFYIEWEEDNLWIYFVRSDTGVLLDRHANCMKCVNISDGYLGRSHWEELSYGKRKVGSDTYQIIRRKIIKTDKDGHRKVVYDGSAQQIILLIVYSLGLCILVKLDFDDKKDI